jgi:DNA-binding transcriptional ArsR family regulator
VNEPPADVPADDGDLVFRALADRHRRTLLDALRRCDGQSLGELCASLPDLGRFGVMKHLVVLADAGLVTSRRDGRLKHHYLNPLPIRAINDRWLSRFQAGWADALGDLKLELERSPANGSSTVAASTAPSTATSTTATSRTAMSRTKGA